MSLRVEFKRGITREVVLIGRWAIKTPSLRSYRLFLSGMLCNLQENDFSGTDERLCPVIFSFIGLILVMRRAEPIKFYCFADFQGLPVEDKLSSFGDLNGDIVAIDYGS